MEANTQLSCFTFYSGVKNVNIADMEDKYKGRCVCYNPQDIHLIMVGFKDGSVGAYHMDNVHIKHYLFI